MFKRKGKDQPVEEQTLDRKKLKAEQITKLREAEDLKRRSDAVARSLSEGNEINHYAQRIRLAYTGRAH